MAGSFAGASRRGPLPILSDDEEGPARRTPEDAGEGAAVGFHCLHNLPTFGDLDTTPVGDIGVPDAALDIGTHAVQAVDLADAAAGCRGLMSKAVKLLTGALPR